MPINISMNVDQQINWEIEQENESQKNKLFRQPKMLFFSRNDFQLIRNVNVTFCKIKRIFESNIPSANVIKTIKENS